MCHVGIVKGIRESLGPVTFPIGGGESVTGIPVPGTGYTGTAYRVCMSDREIPWMICDVTYPPFIYYF